MCWFSCQLGIHDAFRLSVAGEATGVSSGVVEGVPQRRRGQGGKGERRAKKESVSWSAKKAGIKHFTSARIEE